jgi:tetratricopeptide (TPR) repeat protein/cold shock CspA family protein
MEQVYQIDQMDEKESIEKAKILMVGEKWDEAIALLNPFKEAGNLSVDGLHILAYCYSRFRKYNEAIRIYEGLSERFPNEAKWLYFLAYQYRNKKDVQSAIKAYEKCLELSPKWLNVFGELGFLYEENGSAEKTLETYRNGIQTYKAMKSDRQKELAPIYSKITARAAKLICSAGNITETDKNEAESLFRESISADPDNSDTWYRLGDFYLGCGKYDDALQYLQKAESLAPRKEYIPHKIAQVHLKKGDHNQALKIYETIPHNKRAPYILHGMAQCFINKGEVKQGAYYLYLAAQQEPDKWYHRRDLGLALADLRDRDQAIENLNMANELYKKENGKDFSWILAKIDELKEMPKGESIVFEKPNAPVTTISYGTIVRYISGKGYGFIKDENDGAEVFFHVSRVRDRIEPVPRMRVKFSREMGGKGPQAGKVWAVLER